MSLSEAQVAELKKPLVTTHVKKNPRGFDYVEGWHAIDEANRIFGFDAWTRETLDIRCVAEGPRKIGKQGDPGFGVSYVAKVRVTVAGVVREGFGAGHGMDRDLGLAHESAIKEAETDAMKRALMTFGNPFGLALYDKAKENVATPQEIARQEDAERAIAAARAEAENYVERCITGLDVFDTPATLKKWWADEKVNRELHFTQADDPLYRQLYDAFVKRGTELSPKAVA